MESQEEGQPLLRTDDFSEEVISQILKNGRSQKKKAEKDLKVVTHIVHVNVAKDDGSRGETSGTFQPSCKICKDAVDEHYVIKRHSYLESTANPYMCGICGEAFGEGYLLKIHLEVEHGFVENTSRRSLRTRNRKEVAKDSGKSAGRQKLAKEIQDGRVSKTKKDSNHSIKPWHEDHVVVDLDNIQDKENKREQKKKAQPTPDKTILLTSGGSDGLENDLGSASCEEDPKGIEENNKYKNGDLIVINLFTEGGTLSPGKKQTTCNASSTQRASQKEKSEVSDKFKCEFCDRGFRTQQKRGMHIKEEHPDCALKCPVCGVEFEQRRRLTIHLKSHSRVRRPPKLKEVKERVTPECKICNKTFLHESGLQIHTQSFHPEEIKGKKSFCCEKCGSMFWTKTALVEHQRIHSDKKPFVCSFCKKAFCRRSDLKSHTKVHTGEKPFPCPHCERTFRQRLQMVHHIRTHTGEKPYKCDFCEKAFAKRDQFTRHRRVHTKERPYKCSHCGKFFKSKGNLRDHERVHTGAKPFKCSHCVKAFAQYTNLVHHERTHTGLKPYVCPQCQKAFPRSNSLRSHMKSHTNKTVKSTSTSVSAPVVEATPQMPLQTPPQPLPDQLQSIPRPQQSVFHQLTPQQRIPSNSILNTSELLATVQASMDHGFDDVSNKLMEVPSVSQSDLASRFCSSEDSLVPQTTVCSMMVGTPVPPGPSFIPSTVMAGYGAPENEPPPACESIAIVLSNMSDYQPMQVTQTTGLGTFH